MERLELEEVASNVIAGLASVSAVASWILRFVWHL